jgi:hypothetical protein
MTTKEFQRTEFGERLIRHAMRDRARRETGSPESRTSPMFADWRDGLHPWFRDAAADLVRDEDVRLHPHAAAVNSSMAFAFNLFMPFRVAGSTVLEELLGVALKQSLTVSAVGFEFGGPTHVLGECAGTEPTADEKFTASDVAVHVTDQAGRRGVVLIEVKLSEGGYTHCGGATSRGNRRLDVCASAATFFAEPGACYLRRPYRAQRDRRYWDILAAEFGSVQQAVPRYEGERCPFELDYQQMMRNHTLALGLVQAGEVEFAAFGLVHHPDNLDVIEPWKRYRNIVADDSQLFDIPADVIVDAASAQGGTWPDWADFMRERYLLANNTR